LYETQVELCYFYQGQLAHRAKKKKSLM
jgi:hypothetical protein